MDTAPDEELVELLTLAVGDGLRLLATGAAASFAPVAEETRQYLERLLEQAPGEQRPPLELAREALEAAIALQARGDLAGAARLVADARGKVPGALRR